MSQRKKAGFSAFGVGLVLAVLFGVLSSNSSGSNSTGYLVAAIACGIAGAVGLVTALTAKS